MIDRLQNNAMTTNADAQDAGNHQSDGLQGASATARQTGAEKAEGDRRQLPEADQRQFQKLKQRDREVPAHEHAPITAGAGIVQGSASFAFQRGRMGRCKLWEASSRSKRPKDRKRKTKTRLKYPVPCLADATPTAPTPWV